MPGRFVRADSQSNNEPICAGRPLNCLALSPPTYIAPACWTWELPPYAGISDPPKAALWAGGAAPLPRIFGV